jgi:hypothetical protein
LAALTTPLLDTMRSFEIDTPLSQEHFLAQIGHESGALRFRSEWRAALPTTAGRTSGTPRPAMVRASRAAASPGWRTEPITPNTRTVPRRWN